MSAKRRSEFQFIGVDRHEGICTNHPSASKIKPGLIKI